MCNGYYPIELFLTQKEIAINELTKMLAYKPRMILIQDDENLQKSNTFFRKE